MSKDCPLLQELRRVLLKVQLVPFCQKLKFMKRNGTTTTMRLRRAYYVICRTGRVRLAVMIGVVCVVLFLLGSHFRYINVPFIGKDSKPAIQYNRGEIHAANIEQLSEDRLDFDEDLAIVRAPVLCNQNDRLALLNHICNQGHSSENTNDHRSLYFKKENVHIAVSEDSNSFTWLALRNLAQGRQPWSSNDKADDKTNVNFSDDFGPFSDTFKTKSKVVVDVVNPLERLYSVYLDRIYVPFSWEEATKMALSGDAVEHCPLNVDFSKFLRYITKQHEDDETLDAHWATMTSLTQPCDVSLVAVVKGDTFVKDATALFEDWEYEVDNLEYVSESISEIHLQSRMLSLAKSWRELQTDSKLRALIKACISPEEIAKKIKDTLSWRGFNHVGKDTIKQLSVRDVNVLEAVPSSVWTGAMKESLRRPLWLFAVQEAYKNIDSDLLDKVVKMYEQDFKLFQFNSHIAFLQEKGACAS